MRASERIQEIEAIARYASDVWPTERRQRMPQIANRCSRCVLSERCAPLTDGVCRECRTEAPPRHSVAEEQALRREVVRLGLIADGNDNPLVSNHDLLPVNLAVETLRFGYTTYEAELAQQIREGESERAGWLSIFESVEDLARQGRLPPGCIAHTLRQLDLTHAAVGLPIPAGLGRAA